MNIAHVDNVKFEAGNVYLKRIQADSFPSYKAIKKIAEDKRMDVFIQKNKDTKYLPRENMFLVTASKERPVVMREFFQIGKITSNERRCAIVRKEAKQEELSVRIYNAAMNAIEALENRLKKN